jgi:hypothetical protein
MTYALANFILAQLLKTHAPQMSTQRSSFAAKIITISST